MRLRTRRIATMLILLCLCLKGLAQSYGINLPNGKIKAGDLIDSLEARNVLVNYPSGTIERSKYVITHGPVDVNTALDLLAEQFNMSINRLTANSAFLNPLPPPPTAGIHAIVTVTNEIGEMLPSATLEDIDRQKFYYTTRDGTTTVISDSKKVTLKVTYIGMEPFTTALTGNSQVTIRLSQSEKSLDEVITTGYGTGTRRNNTGDRATVNRSQLMPMSSDDPQTVLEGLIPGLLVTPTSGIYGTSKNLTIRGQSSIYNNADPLYVIDKVIFAPGNQSMLNLSANNAGGSLSPFSLISPSDIEKVDVLKDADATAIYGSRGANGVVLITTRRDTATTTHFGLHFTTGASHAPLTLHLMNTPQYLAMRRQAFQNDQLTMTTSTAPDLLVWDTTRYTDWRKWMIGRAAQTDNLQATLAGTYKTTTWFLSLTGLHETSAFPDHPIHLRGNSCFDLDHHSHDNKLDLRLSGLIGLDQNNQFIGLDPTYYQLTAPDAPTIKNPDGSLYFSDSTRYSNPQSLLRQSYQANSYNYLVDGDASYKLCSWLTLQANLGFNSIGNHEFGETPISAQEPDTQPTGVAYFAHTAYTSEIVEPQAELKKQFGNLSLSLLTGYSWQQEIAHTNSLVATGYTNDAWLHQQSKAATTTPLQPASTGYAYRAMFSRVNLNWEERYVLNLTGRRDGTNRFGPAIHYGNFYAAGAAIIFTRFKIIRDALPALSLAKLHASIGVTGNDQIGDHRQSSFAPTNIASFDNIPGFFSSNKVLSGTSWETIHKEELALDLGFVHDRLLLTVARYRHQSKDQLLPQAYPSPGTSDVFRNWPAVLQNSGWEFSVSAHMIVRQNFSWTIDLNWSLPVNRLVSFPNLDQTPFGNILVVGQSATVQQGWRYTGVDPATGIFQFQDINHNGQITDSDRTVIGHLDPKGFGGMTNTFRYKQFQFSILLDARVITGSNYLTALYATNPPSSYFYSLANAPTELNARWQKTGQQSSFQQVTTSLTTTAASSAIPYYTSSSALFTNASFVRLKKMVFSYQTAMKLGRQYHSSLTIFVAGENLFTITPYKDVDPEIQSAAILPLLRTVEAGITLGL
jgi:TonB-linked SusC/RagA family outer membrane protein